MDTSSLHSSGLFSKAPWIERPPSFEPLDQFAVGNLPAIGGQSMLLQFTVPSGRNGVIRWIANEVSSDGTGTVAIDLTNAVTWSLLVNSTAAAQNYANFAGSLGRLWHPSEVAGVRIKENQLVQFFVKNVSLTVTAPAQFAAVRVAGWYYPKRLDSAFS